MRIYGHRGAAALAPENTLPGIEEALRRGADGVECDLRLTADGALVALHDPRVDRVTDGTGAVADLSLAGVRCLDAGARFTADGRTFPYRGRGVRVPTAEEVLEAVAGRGLLILEIKADPFEPESDEAVRAAARLVDILRGRAQQAVVSCLDTRAIDVLRDRVPRVPTAVLAPAVVDPAAALEAAITGGHAECHVAESRVDAALVDACGSAGRTLVAWTVNDPARARALEAMGVDAIITDDPQAVRESGSEGPGPAPG